MRLAQDRIAITLDGRRLVLRPTLRAAMRLEQEIGLLKVSEGILEGHLGTMAAVIDATAGLDDTAEMILNRIAARGLAEGIASVRDALMVVLLALLGYDPHDEPKPAPAGKAPPIAEQLAQLYRIATGWIGWTPEVAWNATAAEILEAHAGRVDMLQAIFGKSEPEKAPVDLDAKFDAVFGGFKRWKVG